MIRLLEGLVLLKEIDQIGGAQYDSHQLRCMHPDKVVVMRHTSYIYKDVLCDVAQREVTNLDDYIPLGELVERLSIRKEAFIKRIQIMASTGSKFFDYVMVCGIYFIKLDDEFKYLFQNYQPFKANLDDANNMHYCKLLGDFKIGFY
jgi:hypothetical protein